MYFLSFSLSKGPPHTRKTFPFALTCRTSELTNGLDGPRQVPRVIESRGNDGDEGTAGQRFLPTPSSARAALERRGRLRDRTHCLAVSIIPRMTSRILQRAFQPSWRSAFSGL